MQLIRGQKIKLGDLTSSMMIEFKISINGNVKYDVSCFGLDSNGKLTDDRFFIFYNQPNSPDGSIKKISSTGSEDKFIINFKEISTHIKKLVFTIAIDGNGSMADALTVDQAISANGTSLAEFRLTGRDFTSEKAIMLSEVYFKDVWRVAAIGQGFNGGLSALLKHFGGEEIIPSVRPPAGTSEKPTVSQTGTVSLTKITLAKRGEKRTLSLAKRDQQIHINLNWDSTANDKMKKGLLSSLFSNEKGSGSVDLDLGCMFELKNGQKGVIQPLGGYFGSKSSEPFIMLDKDDRSGNSADGENMQIVKPEIVSRVLIFALIYEGAAYFSHVNGRLTIKTIKEEILIKLDNPDTSKRFCAVALFENKGDGLVISKEEKYFNGHQECDEFYRFGFSWKAGRK
jgi:tellurite resistance protein TerA